MAENGMNFLGFQINVRDQKNYLPPRNKPMIDPESYKNREQTYIKHYVLKHYLERVAYNIFSFQDDFVYVDGFSGPWKSENEAYEDTSFKIALDQLRSVKQGVYERRQKIVDFRCMFIEKHGAPFTELESAIAEIGDVRIKTINGAFEDHIDNVIKFIGNSFSLIFIDPTGWQGFPMDRISPLLQLRGEVLINFMSDFINRFIDDPRPSIAKTFDGLYGDDWYSEWQALNDEGLSREAAAIEIYTRRLKKFGNFNHVTSTRILKPTSDRSYFYLIYATHHWKGIKEFRSVEKKAIEEQERARDAAKYRATVERTGQETLFGQGGLSASVKGYQEERDTQTTRAYHRLLNRLSQRPQGIRYEYLLGYILETPLVWESDLKGWISELKKDGKIEIQGMGPRQRVVQIGHTITPLTAM